MTSSITINSSPSPLVRPDPSSKPSPIAIMLIKVAFTFWTSTLDKGLEFFKSKSVGNPKFARTIAASDPAASIMVVMAETYFESLAAVRVTVTASPVKVSTPPSATILTPLLSVRSKLYCPRELVVVSAITIPSTSSSFTVEPLT